MNVYDKIVIENQKKKIW